MIATTMNFKKSDFIRPKVDKILNQGKNDGQFFFHELSWNRNWENTLDALHLHLSELWFHVAIATNTRKKFWGDQILLQSINISRSRKELPEELCDLLKLRFKTFGALKKKIRRKVIEEGEGDKDVWHFTSKWKEFPRGTRVIELYQKKISFFERTDDQYKRAFVILDAKCSIAELNSSMFKIKRVFESKDFTNQILKNAPKKTRKTELPPRPKRAPSLLNKKPEKPTFDNIPQEAALRGRGPAGLLINLTENFEVHIKTITLEEKANLFNYLEKLEQTGEKNWKHNEVEVKLNKYFMMKHNTNKLNSDN
jgi:hypothetical protein